LGAGFENMLVYVSQITCTIKLWTRMALRGLENYLLDRGTQIFNTTSLIRTLGKSVPKHVRERSSSLN